VSERIGPYRLETKLGEGGMGEVFKAYDERLDRWVALKRVSPQRSRDAAQRERLLREARASARLSHPAIVQVFDLVRANGADCIIMELVEGTPLSLLLRQGPLKPARAVALAREIAAALGAAHACGIVHRDLKTENVMVTPDGHAKVFDFGISKRLEGREDESPLTSAGVVLGTLRTMAPEQAQGREIDHRADLFSFGVLLYEMLAGRSPFDAPDAAATLHRLCYEPHTPLSQLDPSLPADLSRLVDRLLEKRPEPRPATAAEVMSMLAAIGGESQSYTADGSVTVSEMPAPRWTTSGARSTSAERRQVTVLSCGLVRAAGEPPDPEEMVEVLPHLHAAAVEAASRFEGRATLAGEECRIYFGDRQAHEDDARRAVHAALDLVSRGRDGLAGFAVHAGVHTGPMVVARAAAPQAALGDTPGIAALLKGLAGARTVLVSESTFRQLEGSFECEALADAAIPAGSRPLQLYRVIAENLASNRLHGTGELTPLVGREQELSFLLARWELAREGRGQVALVSGEAGVGKSRLVWELRERARSEGAQWLEGQGSPFHRDSPLFPVVQWLEQWLGAERADPPGLRLERLAEASSRHGLAPEAVPLLATLLALPTAGLSPLPPSAPEVQRHKTLEALLALLLATAERRPLLLVLEDLHWADPSTLELLGLLTAQAQAVPLMLLLTFRPEFEPPWEQRSSVTRLTLGLLTRSQAGLMIDRLAERGHLSPARREQIAARTDGVPLFIEEMTKMVLESAAPGSGEVLRGAAVQAVEIPGTLEGWLMARLDRLGTAKEVAQLAATLGREFSHELLLAVSPWSAEDLARELDRLVRAELLFRRGLPPRERYIFKHALLQDAAYGSLLKSDRQRHHQRIAEALEASFPAIGEAEPELVAHHYTGAALPDRALHFWRRAGEKALLSSAYLEAVSHLEKAFGLLANLPEGADRDELEIGLQLLLGTAKSATQTPVSPEVRDAYERALELCQRGGDHPQLFPILQGLHTYHMVRGQPRQALTMAGQLMEIAEREGSLALRVNALEAMSFGLFSLGDLVAARGYLETVFALGRSQPSLTEASYQRPFNAFLGGVVELGWVLWLLGYPDQALQRSRQAMEKMRQSSLHTTLCVAEYYLADIHIFRREREEVLLRARELAALSAENRLPYFSIFTSFLLGWAAAEQGDASGIQAMQRALEARAAHGVIAGSMPHFTFLAASLLDAGRWAEGLATVEQALAISADAAHGIMDAELHRLKGELLLRSGDAELEAEEQLHRALGIARRQGALSLELRAAMSLARHWRRRGRTAEARELLTAVYEGFTEGFDTHDLREARSLLAELG